MPTPPTQPTQPTRPEPDPPVDAEPVDTAPDDTAPGDTAVQRAEPEVVDAEIVEPTALTPPAASLSTSMPTDYTDQGVPTLDYVRDKIEGRSATAMGWEELRTKEVEEAERKFAEREEKGKAKLEELRRQMGL